MIESIRQLSPCFWARLAGALYLLSIVTGLTGALVGSGHESLADAANLTGIVCYIAVTLILYGIFKPVNKILSLLAALFSLMGCVLLPLTQMHLATLPINPMVCFGVYCLLIGYLIIRSEFMPRVVGVLMALTGLGWLTFISRPLADHTSRYVMALGLLGEGSLTLWLLAMGVNTERWREQAMRPVAHP
jgi:hypothetical protein